MKNIEDIDPAFDAEKVNFEKVLALLRAGKKTDAIITVRDATGWGLKSAKDFVDKIAGTTTEGRAPSSLKPAGIDRNHIIDLLRKGKKLEAIKLVQDKGGMHLDDAQFFVEKLKENDPDDFGKTVSFTGETDTLNANKGSNAQYTDFDKIKMIQKTVSPQWEKVQAGLNNQTTVKNIDLDDLKNRLNNLMNKKTTHSTHNKITDNYTAQSYSNLSVKKNHPGSNKNDAFGYDKGAHSSNAGLYWVIALIIAGVAYYLVTKMR